MSSTSVWWMKPGVESIKRVAGAVDGAVLLSESGGLSRAAETTIEALQPREVVIVGGIRALNGAVEAAARRTGVPEVRRVAGVNRYATAIALMRDTFGYLPVPEVLIATGSRFPDALAGAAAAGHQKVPLLLIDPYGTNTSVIRELGWLLK